MSPRYGALRAFQANSACLRLRGFIFVLCLSHAQRKLRDGGCYEDLLRKRLHANFSPLYSFLQREHQDLYSFVGIISPSRTTKVRKHFLVKYAHSEHLWGSEYGTFSILLRRLMINLILNLLFFFSAPEANPRVKGGGSHAGLLPGDGVPLTQKGRAKGKLGREGGGYPPPLRHAQRS